MTDLGEPHLRILADPDALADAAAEIVAEALIVAV